MEVIEHAHVHVECSYVIAIGMLHPSPGCWINVRLLLRCGVWCVKLFIICSFDFDHPRDQAGR